MPTNAALAHSPSPSLYFRWDGPAEAPKLLLLHPIGADQSLWDEVVPWLTPRFQVLRTDMRGHGGSSIPAGDYQLSQLADDALALCDQLGWDRFAVCGVSLGGMTAAQIAAKAPQRVTALAVCSAAPRMQAPPGGWDPFAQLALTQGMAPIAQGMRELMFGAAFRQAAPAIVDRCFRVTAWMAPIGYAGATAVLRDADLRPQLASIQTPALVMRGQHDSLVPDSAVQAWIDGLPHAVKHVFDAGHFPPLEAPAEFARVLSNFLDQPSGRAP